MSYDLARLRLNGLIERRRDTNTYDLTADGQRVAIFYTKVHDRLLRPLIAADHHPHRRYASTENHRPTRPRLHRPSPPRQTPPETQDGRPSLPPLASLDVLGHPAAWRTTFGPSDYKPSRGCPRTSLGACEQHESTADVPSSRVDSCLRCSQPCCQCATAGSRPAGTGSGAGRRRSGLLGGVVLGARGDHLDRISRNLAIHT